MDGPILPRYISIVESEFVNSKGGLKLKGLVLEYFNVSTELKNYYFLRFRVFRLICREIVFLTLHRSESVLILSAFGPFIQPKFRTYLYFQNIALLESFTLKARLYRYYLTLFQSWTNCYVIVQNDWIYKKYSIFNREKVIVQPFPGDQSSHQKYLFYPTSSHRYKNNENLIRIFSSIKTDFMLVLTVDKSELCVEEIGSNIKCIGSIDAFVMRELYVNAEAVLLCSEYESYSYPLYEALALNKRIIAKQADYLTIECENLKKFNSWSEFKIILKELNSSA